MGTLGIVLLERIQQPNDASADEILQADRGGQPAGEPLRDVFDQGGIFLNESFDMISMAPWRCVDIRTWHRTHGPSPSGEKHRLRCYCARQPRAPIPHAREM